MIYGNPLPPEQDETTESVRDVVSKALLEVDPVAASSFETIFGQMRVPRALRDMLPVGITGVFCAFCIFMMISTDTTYMHSWGSIIVQDIIMPIRGKPQTPRQDLRLLRISIFGVALFAWFFSFLFSQVDYIFMFFAITGAIWTGGAGPCIVGGLYWNRATTAGAFTALFVGSSTAVSGIILQKIWAPMIYPWLEATDRLAGFTRFIENVSKPLEPLIVWRVIPEKFPINSQEILLAGLLTSISLFVIVSLLTCKEPFNMDLLLHRGKYRRADEPEVIKTKLTWKNALRKTIGLNEGYSKGDRLLAWSSFTYGIVWAFGSFLVIVIWNLISPWPDQWWANWWGIEKIWVTGVIGIVSTVWFLIGGTIDLRRLFQRLETKEVNMLDDGRVVNHLNADDVEMVENVDHVVITKAHEAEKALQDALEKEQESDG